MSVDINLIKQLRQATQAPLKDVREALIECDGDFDKAQEYLRKKGAAKAAKKADRETNEGIVKVENKGSNLVGIKLACETDFVAKNDEFVALGSKVIDLIASFDVLTDSVESLSDDQKNALEELLKEGIAKNGENIRLLDCFVIADNGSYIYNHPGNKLVAVLNYSGDEATAKEIALQVAAMNPKYKSREDVPADKMDEMKAVFSAELKDSGKPAEIIEKIMEGKVNKALSEFVLLEQLYIRDDTKKIKDIMNDNFVLNSYIRYSI